jgi:predicted O-methyltransferase YrrM
VELISTDVVRLLDSLVPPRHAEMQAMEAHAQTTSFPIIGPASGYFCYLLTRLIHAHTVFELGSGFGYSTAWFALAVRDNGGGTVHHVVWDDALSQRAQQHLAVMGLSSIVQFHVSEAIAALRRQTERFDVVFNDIDKQAYPASLPVIRDHLRPGGLLITDNALWSGRIFNAEDDSPQTKGVRAYTELLTRDAAWITSLVPIRDGLLVAQLR